MHGCGPALRHLSSVFETTELRRRLDLRDQAALFDSDLQFLANAVDLVLQRRHAAYYADVVGPIRASRVDVVTLSV